MNAPSCFRGALLLIATAGSVACSDGPAEPGVTNYDLEFRLESVSAQGGDCENAAGNPGEFAYEIQVYTPRLVPAIFALFSTNNFPAESGAVTLSEDVLSYPLTGTLALPGIPEERRHDVMVRLSGIEFDPGGRDPDMNYVQAEVPVPYSSPGNERSTLVQVGGVGRCTLSVRGRAFWSR